MDNYRSPQPGDTPKPPFVEERDGMRKHLVDSARVAWLSWPLGMDEAVDREKFIEYLTGNGWVFDGAILRGPRGRAYRVEILGPGTLEDFVDWFIDVAQRTPPPTGHLLLNEMTEVFLAEPEIDIESDRMPSEEVQALMADPIEAVGDRLDTDPTYEDEWRQG